MDFAAVVHDLFGRRADHADGQAEVGSHAGRRDSGPGTHRRDDVVAAGVTDAGQGVILGADGDVQRAVAGARDECGREAADASLNLKPRVRQKFAEPRGCLLFLEPEFGVCVNPMTEGDQAAAYLVVFLPSAAFRIHGHSPFRGFKRYSQFVSLLTRSASTCSATAFFPFVPKIL